jgi:hypothetical protein
MKLNRRYISDPPQDLVEGFVVANYIKISDDNPQSTQNRA